MEATLYEPIKVIRVPNTRRDKRMAIKEYEKLVKLFWHFEEFYQECFLEPKPHIDNNLLYQDCLEGWNINCKYVDRIMKPKFFNVDKYYFVKFKPQ